MTQDARYAEAKKRVEEMKGFYIHLAIYAVVNIGLFFLDLADGGGWWFFWVTIGWGIGVLAHAVAYFFESAKWAKRWEKRKIDEFMRDIDGPGMNPAR